MKISDLMNALQEMKEKHGDVEVVVKREYDDDCVVSVDGVIVDNAEKLGLDLQCYCEDQIFAVIQF